MSPLEYILLSDCRTGGTALTKMLIERGCDMYDGEPLQYPTEDRTLCPWESLGSYKGAHLQRYQVEALSLWTELAALPLRVVSLTRCDKHAQYISWETAIRTGIWTDHPRRRPLPGEFDADRCREVVAQWEYEREQQNVHLGHLLTLHITYEQFDADNDAIADDCAAFMLSRPFGESARHAQQ